ncbi:MAG: D-isomer specific 2-hydroxyacid dehydrogenase NAD-binding protein [Bacillota bacterium]|nr:MAG: D-isomer specific 2-hydroxyacid dehydrogenase NAD-binding protein [Bacillota bacterium]MBS3950542.1 D-2-hydroxyacid dehydrogenase [Peptococcaceae bacterium]
MILLIRGECSSSEGERIRGVWPDAEIISCNREELEQNLPEADVVWGGLRPDQIALGERLRLIQVQSAGVDFMLCPELQASPAKLCTTSGIHAETIAEHVLGMMLSLIRKFPQTILNQSRSHWEVLEPQLLHGKRLGIVGFGSIGQAIGLRARAFGMHVVGLRRHPAPSSCADEIWADDRLNELLPLVDHLVIAVPLTPQTKGLINRTRLQLLKPTAYIYNISRGTVIDEPALTEALTQGRLAGAGLDVFWEEPLPAGSPLWSHPNVLVTPHSAGQLPDYRERAFLVLLENLQRLKDNTPLLNSVDKQAGY